MIVYKCNASWPIFKKFRRYVKMRVSDKDKRRWIRVSKFRRMWYWNESNWNKRHGE